jgi:hypothetical protein
LIPKLLTYAGTKFDIIDVMGVIDVNNGKFYLERSSKGLKDLTGHLVN